MQGQGDLAGCTCAHHQLSLAGDLSRQVPGRAGVDPAVGLSSTQHHQGALIVLVNEAQVAALLQQLPILGMQQVSGDPCHPPTSSHHKHLQQAVSSGESTNPKPQQKEPKTGRGAAAVGLVGCGSGQGAGVPSHLVPHDVRQRLALHHHSKAGCLPFLGIDVLHDGLKARCLCREMGHGTP